MSRILLGAGASAALHKACDLASKLKQAGHEVQVVLTPRAAQLVSPQLFGALTGRVARVDEFGPAAEGAMEHIDWARWGELLVVAPASASLIARLALGMGEDLLGTVNLALPQAVPRLIAPAMNPGMLEKRSVQDHLQVLRGDGWTVLEPAAGALACGDHGRGRLPEPSELLAEVERVLGRRA